MDERTSGPEPQWEPEQEPAPGPGRDPEPGGRLPGIRASDAEREATAHFLQQSYSEGRLTMAEFDERIASAYAARSRSELEALTRDLPLPQRYSDDRPAVGRHQARPAEQPPARGPVHGPSHDRTHGGPPDHAYDRPPARRVTGGTGPGTSIAVMGGVERSGSWTLPAEHTAVAVMGGVEIDLRGADLQAHETTIQAYAFWGGVEILVPDDVRLHVEGFGFMGAFSETSGDWDRDPRPVRQLAPDAPVLRITGIAIMGAVEVRRVSGAGEA